MADGIFLGSLWIRSGHSGHPGANIPRSLSVERTDRAEYSIFKVPKLLFTIHTKYEIFFVDCHSYFKSSLQACSSATGFGESPKICVVDIQTLCLQNHLPAGGGFWAPLSSQAVRKPAGRVNHAMIHSLPAFLVYSEKVNHSMIHFWKNPYFHFSKSRGKYLLLAQKSATIKRKRCP